MRVKSLAGGLACLLVLAMPVARADHFKVWSPDIPGRIMSSAQVLNGAGCTGGNVSPRIEWSGEPAHTRSFLVTIFDQDARSGAGWWHWLVVDIPPSAHALEQGSGNDETRLPPGVIQIRNDFGTAGYSGPCPPFGLRHHYKITVMALKVNKLGVDGDASPAMVDFMANANSLGKAVMTVLYGRSPPQISPPQP